MGIFAPDSRALDNAIATACFWGFPSWTSVEIFLEIVFWLLPFFSGICSYDAGILLMIVAPTTSFCFSFANENVIEHVHADSSITKVMNKTIFVISNLLIKTPWMQQEGNIHRAQVKMRNANLTIDKQRFFWQYLLKRRFQWLNVCRVLRVFLWCWWFFLCAYWCTTSC